MLTSLSYHQLRLGRSALTGLILFGCCLVSLPTLIHATAFAQQGHEEQQRGTIVLPEQKSVEKVVSESTEDKKWGDLVGRFVYDGNSPEQRPITITKQKDVFDRYLLTDESLIVHKNKGIKNIVVFLAEKDIEIHPSYSRKTSEKATMKIEKGRFGPRIVPMWAGRQVLSIESTEPVLTNFHLLPLRNDPYNLALRPNGRSEIRLNKEEQAPIRVASDIHPWMRGYILPRTNPYVAVSESDGTFSLKSLPLGKLTFRIWHEKAGLLSLNSNANKTFAVEIKPGKNDLGAIKLTPDRFTR